MNGLNAGPPTDMLFLVRLESMMSLQSGLDLVDVGFANWLANLLV